MEFVGGVKPAQEEKKEDEGERTAGGDKLEAESIDEDKSEARKRKPEGEKPEHGTKPTEEKIPSKIEKQGTEEQLLGERELSEIEKQNLEEVEVVVVVVVEEDEEKEGGETTGNFIKRKEYSFEDISVTPEIQLQYSSSEDKEVSEEDEKPEGFDRGTAIEKFKLLQAERRSIVKKNFILLKKLAEHFKKRKMEHVCENHEPHSADKEIQYHKQLLAFEDIRTTEKKEREAITKELETMKKERDELIANLKVLFDSLIQKERELGTGLIYTKTGKLIPTRDVEELLLRQTRKLNELNEVRLAFIKLRDSVAAKKAHLRSLETFGENLCLIDYKKLQMENRSYAIALEKGDKELQHLRNKVNSKIQILTQMKEKSYATDEKIRELHELLKYMESEVSNIRGYVTDLKKHDNFLRSETLRVKRAAGLLTQPRLLCDFAASIEEAACLSMKLQNLKNAFFDQKQSLTKIRKSIEAHISNGTVQRENFISSGPKPQQMKSHCTVFRGQKLPAGYASYSKPQLHHPVTSDYIKRSAVVGVKSAMSRQFSRPRTKDPFRLTPLIPISKDGPSFSSHLFEVRLPSKEVGNPPHLNL